MEKKEFAIGEEFQFGLKRLKVVKNDNRKVSGCALCALYASEDCYGLEEFTGPCIDDTRSDKQNVIFIEVEDE